MRLYKSIVRHAKIFPSIKRKELVDEIRTEFREGCRVARDNPQEVERRLAVARKGLDQLKAYTVGLRPDSTDWVVETEKQPMPRSE